MNLRKLFLGMIILGMAACKKESHPITQPTTGTFEFDIAGTHRSFKITQLQLEIDSSPLKQKVLKIFTGDTSLPQVQISITDRTFAYNSNYFVTGTYPSLIADTACSNNGSISYCLGFSMVYSDTDVGRIGTFSVNDSVSLLTIISNSGTPAVLNATFNCVLVDSNNFSNSQQISNGKISNVMYIR